MQMIQGQGITTEVAEQKQNPKHNEIFDVSRRIIGICNRRFKIRKHAPKRMERYTPTRS